MGKEEDLSRQYVLPFLDEQYKKYGEHKQMEITKFDGYDIMSAYEEGYHQAEKDLALTWKDMELIYHLSDEIPYMEHDNFFKELLRRYNEKKKELV